MSNNTLNKYVWLVDTIRRYGRITRQDISTLWQQAPVSDGQPLARRTFCTYRQAIEDLFKINIECDPATYEYYISEEDAHDESVTNWMLNSAAINNVLNDSRDISHRIFLEHVPSAREHLAKVIDSIRHNTVVRFNYHPYTRTTPTTGIEFEPYFVKIFKQRWYMIGRHRQQDKIKTYALDRITTLNNTTDTFQIPSTFDSEQYFRYSFGIVESHNEPVHIVLRADARQAKYLRALPLHHTQQERVASGYSLFDYTMRITPDLIEEILSHGPRITVVEPPALRAAIKSELSDALKNY